MINSFNTILTIVSICTSVSVVVLLILFIRIRIKRETLVIENKLLSERNDELSHSASTKIQIFVRLSQILSSSFSRKVLFQQIVTELSEYYPKYCIRTIVRQPNGQALISGPDSKWDVSKYPEVSFDQVQRAASMVNNDEQGSGRDEYSRMSVWSSFVDRDCLLKFIYHFPILTEEQVQGYLLISMSTQIGRDEYLFFTDLARLLSSVLQNVITVQEKDYINEQFGRSVDPRVRDYLLTNQDGGKMQSVSVLFFDIRSFTTLAEKLGPVKSVALLNQVFTRCDNIIRKNNGFINKFTGDGFMAVFGAPLPFTDHQQKAVKAALEILEGLELPAGIGIASGEAVAGTVGSDMRKEYTVIGDTVNTASRVEGLCKVFGSSLLISGATMENCTDVISDLSTKAQTRSLGTIRLKGKNEPVEIFDLFTKEACYTPEFAEAINAYYSKDFTKAVTILTRLLSQFPKDKAISWYLERCDKRMQEGDGWDGVEQMTEK